MPSGIFTADTALPNFTGQESTEQKLAVLQDYLFLLLENLRYILRHLGPENLNTEEILDWLTAEGVGDGIDEEELEDVIYANSIVANELYAAYGDIADLTVWRLRTDWLRAQNYLRGRTADINYLYIHDETIEFITGSVVKTDGVPQTTQLTRDGLAFYWTDETRSRMTCTAVTAYPVTVYRYDELVKARIAFDYYGGNTYYPTITLGAGDGSGNNVSEIYKDVDKLNITLRNSAGETEGIIIHDSGGVEAPGLFWFGSQNDYASLSSKNPYTVYFITG